jgi:hypothetical protein
MGVLLGTVVVVVLGMVVVVVVDVVVVVGAAVVEVLGTVVAGVLVVVVVDVVVVVVVGNVVAAQPLGNVAVGASAGLFSADVADEVETTKSALQAMVRSGPRRSQWVTRRVTP